MKDTGRVDTGTVNVQRELNGFQIDQLLSTGVVYLTLLYTSNNAGSWGTKKISTFMRIELAKSTLFVTVLIGTNLFV